MIMSPSSIIFINIDLTESIIATFTRQLFLSEVITGDIFDARVAADGYYPQEVHNSNLRIMVMRPLYDLTNRGLADIVLFAKSGLVTVETNKYGPPNITLPIDKVYLSALFKLQVPFTQTDNDLDDGFVGEIDDDNFDENLFGPDAVDPHQPPNKDFTGQ